MDISIEAIALDLLADVVLDPQDEEEGIQVAYEEWMAELEAVFQQFDEDSVSVATTDSEMN